MKHSSEENRAGRSGEAEREREREGGREGGREGEKERETFSNSNSYSCVYFEILMKLWYKLVTEGKYYDYCEFSVFLCTY